MIDMTFLLLVFFMVTTKISKEQVKREIKLPIASNAETPKDLTNRDVINIDGSGQYFVSDRPVTAAELKTYLKQRFVNNPPLRLYIRADAKTPGKKIKDTIRMAADAGAIDVIFGSYQK
jgi:biopolymer transport protein ExbD